MEQFSTSKCQIEIQPDFPVLDPTYSAKHRVPLRMDEHWRDRTEKFQSGSACWTIVFNWILWSRIWMSILNIIMPDSQKNSTTAAWEIQTLSNPGHQSINRNSTPQEISVISTLFTLSIIINSISLSSCRNYWASGWDEFSWKSNSIKPSFTRIIMAFRGFASNIDTNLARFDCRRNTWEANADVWSRLALTGWK